MSAVSESTPENSWMGVSGHTFWLGVETKIGRGGELYGSSPQFADHTAVPSHGLQSILVMSPSVQNSLPITSRIKPQLLDVTCKALRDLALPPLSLSSRFAPPPRHPITQPAESPRAAHQPQPPSPLFSQGPADTL